MTDRPPIDPERLAALLDGRLSPTEAAAVRRQLSSADDDTLLAYADAVAVARELDGSENVTRPNHWATRARLGWLGGAVAAAAAIVAIVAWPRGSGYEPSAYASALPTSVQLTETPVWGLARGARESLSTSARAARIGATLTDLEAAAIRGDSTRVVATALVNLLTDAPGGTQLANTISSMSPDSLAHLSAPLRERVGRDAMEIAGRDYAVAGAYLEAVRLAAGTGDTAFAWTLPRSSLASVERDAAQKPALQKVLATFAERLAARPRDAAALAAATAELLGAITR